MPLPTLPDGAAERALSAEPATVLTGLRWAEGPLWADRLGGLLVSDVKGNTVWLVRPGREPAVFLRPSGESGPHPPGAEHGANGLALDARGALVLCDHGTRGVYRLDEDRWLKKPLATHFRGDRLNSPNDVALHEPTGALFVTDPPFGLAGLQDDPRRELPVCAVFRVCDRTGHVDVATDALSHPNGIAFAPDGRTAFVTNSSPDAPRWLRFEVRADGLFGPPDVFHEDDGPGPEGGLPDGLAVAACGTLFGAGPRGLYVFDAAGGLVGTRAFGRAVSNVAVGEGGRALYLTATDRVLRLGLGG